MGIRMDQHMGLSPEARTMIAGEKVLLYYRTELREMPNGESVKVIDREPVYGSSVKCEETPARYVGMFFDEYPLYKYILPDGTELFETVQAEPWSSGPCFFLCLRDSDGYIIEESKWSQVEIDNA